MAKNLDENRKIFIVFFIVWKQIQQVWKICHNKKTLLTSLKKSQ
jgi:hypothetical protein